MAVKPPYLAERLPVLEAVCLSPYFKRNFPVFEHDGLFRPKMLQVVEIYRFIYIY